MPELSRAQRRQLILDIKLEHARQEARIIERSAVCSMDTDHDRCKRPACLCECHDDAETVQREKLDPAHEWHDG